MVGRGICYTLGSIFYFAPSSGRHTLMAARITRTLSALKINETRASMEEPKLKASFNISTLLLLTTLIALFYCVFRRTGFGDFYYLELLANELRRFGFTIALAISALAIMSLTGDPRNPSLWVGAQVFVLLTAIVSIRYCCLSEISTEPLGKPGIPPTTYSALFLVLTSISVTITIVAACCANFRLAWILPLISSLLVELYISLVLLIVARKPATFWSIYQILADYELIIFTVGIGAALMLVYLSFNEKRNLTGTLAALVFNAIPACSRAYETWILGI